MVETIFYVENTTVLILPRDTYKVTQGIKESFNYLVGLTEMVDMFKKLRKTTSERDIQNEMDLLRTDLTEYQKDPAFKTSKNFPGNNENEPSPVKEAIKRGLLIKEKIDKLQLYVLQDYTAVFQQLLDTLTKAKPFISQDAAQVHLSVIAKLAFFHSPDEAKVDFYILLIDGEKYDSSVDPYKTYFNFVMPDYGFLLAQERLRFQYYNEQVTSLIFSLEGIQSKRNLDDLVVKQYSFNKQMVILTYVIGVLTLVMAAVAFVPLFSKK